MTEAERTVVLRQVANFLDVATHPMPQARTRRGDDFGGLGLVRYYRAVENAEMRIRFMICAVVGHRPVRGVWGVRRGPVSAVPSDGGPVIAAPRRHDLEGGLQG
jgi:hypothetical protein